MFNSPLDMKMYPKSQFEDWGNHTRTLASKYGLSSRAAPKWSRKAGGAWTWARTCRFTTSASPLTFEVNFAATIARPEAVKSRIFEGTETDASAEEGIVPLLELALKNRCTEMALAFGANL